MEKELCNMKMVVIIKEIGLKIKNMVSVRKKESMELNMKGIILWVKNME